MLQILLNSTKAPQLNIGTPHLTENYSTQQHAPLHILPHGFRAVENINISRISANLKYYLISNALSFTAKNYAKCT